MNTNFLEENFAPGPSRTEQYSETSNFELCWFEDLQIGDRFTVRFLPGVYFKTGPESYGVAPGEAEWDAGEIVGTVRKHRTLNFEPRTLNTIVKIDFSKLPEAA